MVRVLALFAFLIAEVFSVTAVNAETRLLMFEEQGCPYCEAWHEEIGVVYDKTDEGKRAPVTVLDLDDPLPAGVEIGLVPYYTPTFILISDGVEIDRIEGYPGEDFFYWMVEKMLAKISAPTSSS